MLASVVPLGTIDVEFNETRFAVALTTFGVPAGLLLSQTAQRDHVVGRPGQDNEAIGAIAVIALLSF